MIYYRREGNIKKRTSHLWPRLWSMRHKMVDNHRFKFSRKPVWMSLPTYTVHAFLFYSERWGHTEGQNEQLVERVWPSEGRAQLVALTFVQHCVCAL